VPPWSPFPQAPLWSPSQRVQSFRADSHTPCRSLVCFPGRFMVRRPSRVRGLLKLPSAPSPFARARCNRARRGLRGPRQQVLPRRHCSYGLMRQSSPLLVPRSYPPHPVCAGGCQPLLGEGPSRRSLGVSVPACLDSSPGSSWSASTRFFLHDSGLPLVRTGSALSKARTAIAVRRPSRGCRHFVMCRPTGMLATQIAPPATADTVWQP
jgi:hypothetical protein